MDQTLEEQRKAKFIEALQQTYAGCVLDIDGTLTVRGEEFIPAFMHQMLADLSMRIPVAVCSGRKLSHAYEKMAPIFTRASNPSYCQANWIFLCENGSIGYFFDSEKKQYVEFYRASYPYSASHREALFSQIERALQGKLGISFLCEVSMVFRPLDFDKINSETLMVRCQEMVGIVAEVLKTMDPKGALKIGNSGTGVIIFPHDGNKERGTFEFAKYLRNKKGLALSENIQEFVIIGDQPGPSGNDETFLNGHYGLPFTVGEVHPQNFYPLPVYDQASGAIIKGPEGTITLLQALKFRNF